MKPGEINEYGFDDGKRGLEVRYVLLDEILYIKILGSNHWRDYLDNLIAWPRKKYWRREKFKFHRVWWKMARGLFDHIMGEVQGHYIEGFNIMGHSMGGAVAAIMPFLLPSGTKKVWIINAPKCGNRAVSKHLPVLCELTALYDYGDIVRRLPAFYSRYPNLFPYDRTRPFWKAHNNLPAIWRDFPA